MGITPVSHELIDKYMVGIVGANGCLPFLFIVILFILFYLFYFICPYSYCIQTRRAIYGR